MFTFDIKQLPTSSYNISGSFTGSFSGDGSNLTGITATVSTSSLVTTSSFNQFTSSIQSQVNNLTNSTSSFTRNSQTSSMSVATSSYSFTSSYYLENDPVFTSISASLVTTSSFNQFTSSYNTGSWLGTSSYASNSNSSSYALTASYVLNQQSSTSTVITGSVDQITVSNPTGSVLLTLASTVKLSGSLWLGGVNQSIQWGSGGSFFTLASDGVFRLGDSSGGGSPRLILGSAGASTGISLLRNSSSLHVRNGDNTAFASVSASAYVVSGGLATQFLKGNGTLDSTSYTPTTRTITINGTALDLSADRSWTISGGSLTVGATSIVSGSSGRIAFNSGSVYGESSNLVWDNTNRRIGIGTSAPAVDIDVIGSPLAYLRLQNSGGNSVHLFNNNTSTFLRHVVGASIASEVSLNSNNVALMTNSQFYANDVLLNVRTYIGGIVQPTARLHLAAGTATAGFAPLKLTAGTNLTTPETGVVEYNGTNLFFTPSSTRNIIAQISGSTALSTGQIPFATTNGYLTSTSNLSWDSTNNYLTLTSNAATTGPTLRLYDTNASGRNFEISNANGANYATMYWKVGASAGAAPSNTLMTLTNSGYLALGLGNTNGSYPIDIGGAGVGGTLLRAKGSQANHDIIIGNSSNNVFFGAYNSSCQILTQGNPSFPAVTITYSTTPNVGIALGTSNPTARLHIAAGTATANTAPLKLTSGTNLTTPEDGAFEFDGTNLYFTVGGVRKIVSLT